MNKKGAILKNEYLPKDTDPETAYQNAKEEWDRFIGSATKQKEDWKKMAFFLVAVLSLSIVGNIYLSNKSTVIPYVIELDAKRGAVLNTTKLITKDYRPNDATIKAKLAEFIELIQPISIDQMVLQNNLLKAYDMVTADGYKVLTLYIRKREPFKLVGNKAVSVSNITVTQITGDSYQVEWQQDEFKVGSGKTPEPLYFSGVFTVKIDPPKTEDEILKNPLGIKVDGFDITRKY